MDGTPPTVFIVDDDEAVRDGLGELLRAEGIAARPFDSAEDFLAAKVERDAGCLIVDIHMPGLTGLALQRDLSERGVRLPVIVITGQGDVPKAVEALKAGAVDFIEKPFSAETLLKAVHEALNREDHLRRTRNRLSETRSCLELLTAREREVMELMVAGHPNKIIGIHLNISTRTVENHRAKVMEKMRCDNLSALIHLILRMTQSADEDAWRPG
ncbi:response regulator transcription factor [Telmatospirillum siberiense]|uniref:DNA-binding response regulator n=1 Tax=Telmatospirillum siberiense TaxID=382514 RepID=A0A2N3PW30_9PROT|nr:response regulator [Telmatospirillum siberiense]PKU24585.1 DNA-binding response regulator [Telmatospirillum siberiense]